MMQRGYTRVVQRKTFEGVPCPIARTLDVIGDWWAPLIIRECLYGAERFDEIQAALGIGRNILSRRLEQMVEQEVLEKRPSEDHAARSTYHLTDKGYDAATVLLAMFSFAERWFFRGGRGEPIAIYDRGTGARVRPVVIDAQTRAPIDPRQLFAGPGPGFPPVEHVRRARFREHYAREDAAREATPAAGGTKPARAAAARRRRRSPA
jgi:DNA-binding HxlR family transcriptional regulator